MAEDPMPLEPREVCLLQSSALGAAGIGDQERRLLRSHNARVFSFRSSKLCPSSGLFRTWQGLPDRICLAKAC